MMIVNCKPIIYYMNICILFSNKQCDMPLTSDDNHDSIVESDVALFSFGTDTHENMVATAEGNSFLTGSSCDGEFLFQLPGIL